jgi:hypothetical protein
MSDVDSIEYKPRLLSSLDLKQEKFNLKGSRNYNKKYFERKL